MGSAIAPLSVVAGLADAERSRRGECGRDKQRLRQGGIGYLVGVSDRPENDQVRPASSDHAATWSATPSALLTTLRVQLLRSRWLPDDHPRHAAVQIEPPALTWRDSRDDADIAAAELRIASDEYCA